MNARQKEVLVQHRAFLSRNIVWTDALARRLLEQGVITDSVLRSMAGEPKSPTNGRHRIAKFLDSLSVRGAGVFEKLCDTLYLHGHPFLADFLKDEENSTDVVEARDIYTLVPVLSKVLKDSEKKTLEDFIVEKATETHLRHTWAKQKIAREKDKAIEARQKQLEDAFDYEVKEKSKNDEIANLESKLADLRKEIVELNSGIDFFKSQMQNTESKMKADFDVQMKFSMANENVIQRLQEKHNKSQNCLLEIEQKLKSILKPPPRTSERDQMAITDFQFAFVSQDLDSLIDKYNILLQIEKQYDDLLHERNYILAHLGVHPSDEHKPTLLEAYRDFAVRTDEDLTTLKEKLSRHTNTIESHEAKIETLHKEVEKHHEKGKAKNAGTVWQNAIMNVMRKQLADEKRDNRIKDSKLKHFESEIAKLKARIAELESRRGSESKHAGAPVHNFYKHGHNHAQSHSYNHGGTGNEYEISSVSPLGANDETDSHLSKADDAKKRNYLLPPLGGRILFQSEDAGIPASQTSPRRIKIKNIGTSSISHSSGGPLVSDGLIASQLRLENRGYVPHSGSGKMGNGLGNLKTMHGKGGKTTHA